MKLDDRTLKNILGCDPRVKQLVTLVAELGWKFKVADDGGSRDEARQAQLVKAGVSRTMNSRHLTGKAVDLIPLPVDWENSAAFFLQARIVRQAAHHLGLKVIWGGVFDRHLSQLGPDLASEHAAYIKRKRAEGIARPLVDLPHFELSRKVYG